jgi:hypothetical protein
VPDESPVGLPDAPPLAALGGGHRARGHCAVAFDLLVAMTAPAYQPKAARR